MEKGIREDEALKGLAHGLVLGVLLIPLAYNVWIRKWKNVGVYGALGVFEMLNILEHYKDAQN